MELPEIRNKFYIPVLTANGLQGKVWELDIIKVRPILLSADLEGTHVQKQFVGTTEQTYRTPSS